MGLTNNYSTGTVSSEENCHFLPLGHLYGMLVVNILSMILGTIGNVLVIGTVRTNFALQIISNYWLVSMAVADLFVTAIGQPLFVVFLGLQLIGECNSVVSQVFRLIANMSCSASVLHLCLISVDRCLVILRPHDFRKIRTKKRFRIALVIAWILPVVYGILRLTLEKSVTSYFTVTAVGLCFVVIILCYSLIILKVRKQGSLTLKRIRGSGGRNVASEHMIERRVTVTIAIVVVIFTVCWFPLLYLRSAFAEENFGVAYNWARTLALSNSSMNPWIYCFRIAEFREAYNRLMRCQWKPTCRAGAREPRDPTTGTHSSDLETTTANGGPYAL
ncbi:histamine H2 receptor-like [Montipora capricornis]|uniref:histamine H2 receptor-like n=1 Tax=Montipora capricornis TaxID=246305 RepID=UPI0035F1D0FB